MDPAAPPHRRRVREGHGTSRRSRGLRRYAGRSGTDRAQERVLGDQRRPGGSLPSRPSRDRAGDPASVGRRRRAGSVELPSGSVCARSRHPGLRADHDVRQYRGGDPAHEHVRDVHSYVKGTRPDGVAYRALDPELIAWVHTCIPWMILRAYDRTKRRLTVAEKNAYLAEQAVIGRMGGADRVPTTV